MNKRRGREEKVRKISSSPKEAYSHVFSREKGTDIQWWFARLMMAGETHTISRLVRLPMLGESRPERFWLGASLGKQIETER